MLGFEKKIRYRLQNYIGLPDKPGHSDSVRYSGREIFHTHTFWHFHRFLLFPIDLSSINHEHHPELCNTEHSFTCGNPFFSDYLRSLSKEDFNIMKYAWNAWENSRVVQTQTYQCDKINEGLSFPSNYMSKFLFHLGPRRGIVCHIIFYILEVNKSNSITGVRSLLLGT